MEKETTTYEEWKAELIKVTAKETGISVDGIIVDDAEAKRWYDDGVSPYMCFRETWGNENEGL